MATVELPKRVQDQLARAARRGAVEYTRFLDPAQARALAGLAAKQAVNLRLEGGYAQAERCMGAIFCGDETANFPMETLEIAWNKRFAFLEHRDILGALMHLGLERDSFGDIVPGEGYAFVWVCADLAGYICANLSAVGRVAVQVAPAHDVVRRLPRKATRAITGTVKQPRLDAVVALAYSLPRAKAAQGIRSGLVKLDHAEETRIDRLLSPGAMLSFAGKGRAQLVEIGGESRKGRSFVTIERFL